MAPCERGGLNAALAAAKCRGACCSPAALPGARGSYRHRKGRPPPPAAPRRASIYRRAGGRRPRPAVALGVAALAAACVAAVPAPTALVHRIDHQFRAPGDPLGVFDSKFNDPEALKSFGYTGQAGRYVEAAVTFDALPGGPFFPEGSEERAWMQGYADAVRAEMNATAAAGLAVYNHMDFPILPKKVVEAYAPKICMNSTAHPCRATWGAGLLQVP
jgi:hypothetical protein